MRQRRRRGRERFPTEPGRAAAAAAAAEADRAPEGGGEEAAAAAAARAQGKIPSNTEEVEEAKLEEAKLRSEL